MRKIVFLSDRKKFFLILTLIILFLGGIFIFSGSGLIKPVIGEKKDEYRIVINTYSRQLVLYRNAKIYKTYPVAIGKATTKSPVGEWAIVNKYKKWGGGFGSRWMGLNVPWGIYGIHGTNNPGSIGRAASHGCIRMHNSNVEDLYEIVPIKTRVKIIGQRLPIFVNYELSPGQTGLAVMQLQDNLKKFDYEPSYMDARYGPSTQEAVQELEAQFGLKVDGRADWNIIYLLELSE